MRVAIQHVRVSLISFALSPFSLPPSLPSRGDGGSLQIVKLLMKARSKS